MKEVVATTPLYPGGGPAFMRQILTAVMDPSNMQQFFSDPDNLQRILALGLSNLTSIHSALNPDYKLQEMIGMNETPGYRIPGLDPSAETDLAAGGFDYLGPHSPSLPTTPPPSGIPSSTPEPVYFEKLSSNKRFSQVNPTQKQPTSSEEPPMPNFSFEDMIASLKKIEQMPIPEQDKIANYRARLQEYSSSMNPLRNWLSENGINRKDLKGIVNETRKRK
jgi:hypothetical protein